MPWKNAFQTRYLLVFIFVLYFTSTAAQIKLKGQILDKEMTPLFPATVSLQALKSITTTTDFDDFFSLDVPLENINDSIKVAYIGYNSIVVPISSYASKENIVIVLEYSDILLSEVFVSSSPSITKEFAVKSITSSDIYMTSGASADPLKAISVLPFSTNVAETASPELRGSSADYSRVVINNVPIYKPIRNQQLNGIGNFSLFNPEIINKQEVYASNPPLKYGNSIAGLIDIQTIDKLNTNSNLILSLSAATTSALLSQKINNKSFIQLYGNYQFSSLYKKINSSSLNYLNNFKTIDVGVNHRYNFSKSLYFNLYSYFIDESYSSTNYQYNYTGNSKAEKTRNFNVINFNWEKNYYSLSINNGTSFAKSNYVFGNIDQTHKEYQIFSSIDFKFPIIESLSVQTGISHDYIKHNYSGLVPILYLELKPDSPNKAIKEEAFNHNLEYYLYGKYFLNDYIIIGAGLRKNIPTSDQPNYLSYQLNSKFNISKHHSILFGLGNYNGYTVPEYNLRKIGHIESKQVSIEYLYTNNPLDLGLSLYHKKEETPLFYDELGNIYNTILSLSGFEFHINYKIIEPLQVSFSYAFLDSQFKQPEESKWKRYYNDMDYMFKFSLSYYNAKLLNVGLNYTCRSGQYYTPMFANKDLSSTIDLPTFGNYFGSQMNRYSSLDLTVNKYFKLAKTDLVIFSSVNNILNRQNNHYVYYSEDYSKELKRNYQKIIFYFGFRLSI